MIGIYDDDPVNYRKLLVDLIQMRKTTSTKFINFNLNKEKDEDGVPS